ncbi:unnamed protein product [Closterium sp. NIES-64]|nr:unnamed protein product [Closterium sp. NIES-64]
MYVTFGLSVAHLSTDGTKVRGLRIVHKLGSPLPQAMHPPAYQSAGSIRCDVCTTSCTRLPLTVIGPTDILQSDVVIRCDACTAPPHALARLPLTVIGPTDILQSDVVSWGPQLSRSVTSAPHSTLHNTEGIRYDVTSCARLPLTVIGPTDIFLSDVPLVKALQLHLLHLCSPPAADILPAAATPLLPSPRASCALLCSPPAADTLPAAATPLLPSPHSSCALLCSPTAADTLPAAATPLLPSPCSAPISPFLPSWPLVKALRLHLLHLCFPPPNSHSLFPCFPPFSPISLPFLPPFPYQPLHRGVAGIDANAPLPLRPHRLLRLSIVGVVVIRQLALTPTLPSPSHRLLRLGIVGVDGFLVHAASIAGLAPAIAATGVVAIAAPAAAPPAAAATAAAPPAAAAPAVAVAEMADAAEAETVGAGMEELQWWLRSVPATRSERLALEQRRSSHTTESFKKENGGAEDEVMLHGKENKRAQQQVMIFSEREVKRRRGSKEVVGNGELGLQGGETAGCEEVQNVGSRFQGEVKEVQMKPLSDLRQMVLYLDPRDMMTSGVMDPHCLSDLVKKHARAAMRPVPRCMRRRRKVVKREEGVMEGVVDG